MNKVPGPPKINKHKKNTYQGTLRNTKTTIQLGVILGVILGVPKSAPGLRGSKSVTFDEYFISTTDHFLGGLALRENG